MVLSPLEDVVLFHQLIEQIVAMPSIAVEETSHPVLDLLGSYSRSTIILPLLDVLLQAAKSIWSSPLSAHPILSIADKLY